MEDAFVWDRKNMNLIERLISEVAKRPVLWDRYHNDYSCRSAMDQEWEKIAALMQKDKDFIKQKWRNLRDQFQRESKKVKVPFDNPTKPYIQYYRGKWIYFEHMLFLKEIVSKRTSNCSTPPQETRIRDEDIKEEIIEFEDDMYAYQINHLNNETVNFEIESSNTLSLEETPGTSFMQPEIEVHEHANFDDHSYDTRYKRKGSDTESDIPDKIRRPLMKDASTSTDFIYELDDDLHFYKSLQPYLKKLSPVRKLLVRNEIQSLLIRESLCEHCKFRSSTINP